MKTRLLAMGAAVFITAALAACGGGGGGGNGGGGGGGGVIPTPTPTPTTTATPTPGSTTTVTANSSSATTAAIPSNGGYGGTITIPPGSGTITITDSVSNPTAVTLQSFSVRRPQATASPNPYGCVGTTPYAVTGPHSMVAPPNHPVAGGDTFAYIGSVATTFTQSAPCPEPTATSSATATVNVVATPTTIPGGIGSGTDMHSTETDAFATHSTTTVTDQYVQNTANGYVMYEQGASDGNGNSQDIKYTNPQLLDKSAGGTWGNNPAATLTESLADGTHVSRTTASDGSYVDNETFPSVTVTNRMPLFYVTITAQTAVTLNGAPGLTLTVPANVSGSVYLGQLQNGVWTQVAGPFAVSSGTVTVPSGPGSVTLTQGQVVYLALYSSVTSSSGGGTASISVNGAAAGSALNGAGVYNLAGTSFSYAAPTGPVGSGSITLTIGTSTTRTFPAWFNVPSAYISDTLVNNGSQTFDANCSVSPAIGTTGTQIVETNTDLDPVLGYLETRVTTSYVVAGFGSACVKIDDTLNSFYDYQNDTTKIDYQSQNAQPNSVDHIVEYLGMTAPLTAYPAARTRSSAQTAVSPSLVLERTAAIELKRAVQRAAKMRALRDALLANGKGASL